MYVAIALFQLFFQIAQFAIQVALQLLVMAAQLAGWLFREVVVPGARAAAAGLTQLAGVAARYMAERRAQRQILEQSRWTAADERAARALFDGEGEHR